MTSSCAEPDTYIDRNWPPDDWPWIPFWSYEPWEPIFTVLKITYYNVQVGENNSYLNQITCVVQGETYHIEVIVTGPAADDAGSQTTLLSISVTSGGVVFLLLIAIFLLHRQYTMMRMRVGTITDPEVCKLGKNLQVYFFL
uniref:Uncharacterized protein n=1 Tax=Branchiostoma floridae TaxID=7739 RepID=C3YWB7_BRAFL|eukprot:XP_002599434.1 hypothetical protein BRAFLDRAFT_106577 [Branchiostoma floridae]